MAAPPAMSNRVVRAKYESAAVTALDVHTPFQPRPAALAVACYLQHVCRNMRAVWHKGAGGITKRGSCRHEKRDSMLFVLFA